jgi:D-alanyl-D-alanine carboxypeptidase
MPSFRLPSLPGIPANTPVMFAGPAVLVIVVVLLSRVVSGGGAVSGNEREECPGPGCPVALGFSQTPAPVTPTPSPRPTPPPVVVSDEELPLPDVEGNAFAVLELPCGALLQERNSGLPLPPASLTKIVTALVTVDQADLDDIVSVQIDGGALSLETDSTVMGLEPGDRLPVRDLLYGLLLRSGNDAALELAEHIAGDEDAFVDLMNQKVAELGLPDTQFTNSHGLHSPGLYSSAIDMARLGAAVLADPVLSEIVQTKDYQPAWDRGPIDNLNLLLNNYPGAIGVKTGFTDIANQTIVAAAERDGRAIVVTILGTTFMYEEAPALLDWAFSTEPACGAPAG